MNRVLYAITALGAALVVLVIVLFVRDQQYKASVRPAYVFDPAEASDIVRLHVVYQEDSATLVKAGGRWVTLPDSFPADPSRMATALDRLLKVEDKERVSISTDTARLMEFGLHDGEVKRVSWETAKGKVTRIFLGSTAGTDFSSTYWKREDKPDVYRTPGNFTHEVAARPVDWKDRTLFPSFQTEDIRSLEVSWHGEGGDWVRYRLERDGDSTFRMTAPRAAEVPAAGALGVIQQVPLLIVDGVVAHDDPVLSLFALDSHQVVIEFALANGSRYKLAPFGEVDGEYYARHPVERTGVIKVAKWRIDALLKTPEELLAADSVAPESEVSDEYETIDLHEGHGH